MFKSVVHLTELKTNNYEKATIDVAINNYK